MAPHTAGSPRAPEGIDRTFRASPEGAAQARACLVDWLHTALPEHPRLADDVTLAASEACANAALHAYPGRDWGEERTFGLALETDGVTVNVMVTDEGAGMVPRVGGHGLGLGLCVIAALCDELRVRSGTAGEGTVVAMQFSVGASRSGDHDAGVARRRTGFDGGFGSGTELLRLSAFADVDSDSLAFDHARDLARRGNPDYRWLIDGLDDGGVMLLRLDLSAELRRADGSHAVCSSVLKGVWVESGSVPSVEHQVAFDAAMGVDAMLHELDEQGSALPPASHDGLYVHVEMSPRLRRALGAGRTAVAALTATHHAAGPGLDGLAAVQRRRRKLVDAATSAGRISADDGATMHRLLDRRREHPPPQGNGNGSGPRPDGTAGLTGEAR